MDNMELYNFFREVPDNAKKEIKGGRLSGMTDINPMWRIRTLTNRFGPCGIGWKYIIKDKRLERGLDNEVAAFVDIDLLYKIGDIWSEPIPGTGGASFVKKEKSGPYVSDECFKMALTDALSVACKALGIGADVYWEADRSKYTGNDPTPPPKSICSDCGRPIKKTRYNGEEWSVERIMESTLKAYGVPLCWECSKIRAKDKNGQPN